MTYVWAAYTAVWLFIFGYTLTLSGRQKKIEREIALLKETIERESRR
ncbi:MAG TPA: CcmD family protein [Clostridia bacterium]|nr:CcmD family protein [Clostridia bacterium]